MIQLFQTEFMPHGHCYLWDTALVWINALSNGAMALSYLVIAIAIKYIVIDRKNLTFNILFILFATSILGSCLTHAMEVVNIWKPYYRINSIFQTITSLSALGTAFMLVRIAPQISIILNTKSFKKIIEELNSEIALLKEQDNTKELLNQNLLVEQALKHSEDRFYAIANNIPNLVWIADTDQVISWFNKRWFEYTGLTQEEIDKGGLQSVIAPDELPDVINNWTAAIKTQESFEMILSIKGHDGCFRPFLTRVVPLKDDNGTVTNWVGSNTDISDRVAAEQLLKEQNAELLEFRELAIDEMQNKTQILNGFLEYAPVIIYKINNDGVITDAYGSGIKAITDKCDLKGKMATDISLHISIEEINILAENRKSYISQGSCKGNTWYFENYFFPDRVSNDGIIGIGMDITAQKEISKQLHYEKERAENANFFKTRFLANMSHEIRTPLNAIIGFAQVLSKQNIDPERQKEYLSHINSSGGLLLKLIGDILDLSKIEEGKLSLREESFCFKEIISSAILPYKYKANEKGLYFSLHFDEFIPAYVIGDAYRIKQIIINLIGNALKFTEEGGINILVSNKPTTTKDCALIEIALSDTGIGIEDDNKIAIFESFTQADNTIARKFGGSGLGLTIVRQLVDKMKGNIWVEDNRDASSGSTFFITLPLKIDKTTVKPSLQDKSLNAERLHFATPVKILIAEDNLINQDLVGIVLKNLGATFDFANNGSEAVEMFQKNQYDLVLMDVQMPIMSGLEAAKKIRKISANIPIIALTANVYKEDIDSCKASGMNDHLPKPFSEHQIFEAVQKWVTNQLKYIDLTYLKTISFGDVAMIEELISRIIAQNKLFLANYFESVSLNDWVSVSSIVHQWKSTSRIIGISQLHDILISIETALESRENEFDYAKQYELLRKICEGVEAEMLLLLDNKSQIV